MGFKVIFFTLNKKTEQEKFKRRTYKSGNKKTIGFLNINYWRSETSLKDSIFKNRDCRVDFCGRLSEKSSEFS